jgi:hypothetical protein
MSSGADEPEPQKSLKKLTWQSENCLSCVWFSPNDPLNADILERGYCIHAKLKPFELIVSGRDWCNLFTEIRQKQIDLLQEKAMKAES